MTNRSIRTPLLLVTVLGAVAGACVGLIPALLAERPLPVYVGLGGLAAVALYAAHLAGSMLLARFDRLRQGVRHATRLRSPRPVPERADEFSDIAHAVNRVVERATRVEQEGRRASLRLSALLEQAPDAVLLLDRGGRVVDANLRARAMLGQELALLGRERASLSVLDLVSLMPEDTSLREVVFHAFSACVEDGATRLFDAELLQAEGKPLPVEIHLAPVRGLRGVAAQAVVRDTSARRASEVERIETAKMEGIGTLAAGVAHDFNNVLGGILGYASMIKSSVVPGDPVYRYTDIIERSAERASEMTQQLLGYARRARTQVTRVWLGELVDEVLSLLVEDLQRHRIHISRDVAEDLPPLAADAGQLHQVMLNLCINARDAMHDGGELTVRARTADLAPGARGLPPGKGPGRYVTLEVADTGTGMTPEVRERVFEPYFSTKPEGGGTGLGLAMVWGIVTDHGGWIDVWSEPGRGSRFTVVLPSMQAPPALAEVPMKPSAEVAPLVTPAAPEHGGETILVADDEPVLLDLAREILEGAGYTVLPARDGAEAVEIFRDKRDAIDLVVLDIVMPRMGGREAFRLIREADPRARVMVCSTFSRHGQAHDLLEAGADEFIQKPYRADGMLRVVRKVLDGARSGAPRA